LCKLENIAPNNEFPNIKIIKQAIYYRKHHAALKNGRQIVLNYIPFMYTS